MRKILFLLLMVIGISNTTAQTPTEMQYQLLITNPNTGLVRSSENVSVRIELREGSSTGTAVFSNDFNVTTDERGLCTLSLDFGSDIDWGNNNYYLASIIDGEECGAPRLTSVPYAMQAANLDGLITAKELVGTWTGTCYDGSYSTTITIDIKADGTGTWYDSRIGGSYSDFHSKSFSWRLQAGIFLISGTETDSAEPESYSIQEMYPIFKIDDTHFCMSPYGEEKVVTFTKQ